MWTVGPAPAAQRMCQFYCFYKGSDLPTDRTQTIWSTPSPKRTCSNTALRRSSDLFTSLRQLTFLYVWSIIGKQPSVISFFLYSFFARSLWLCILEWSSVEMTHERAAGLDVRNSGGMTLWMVRLVTWSNLEQSEHWWGNKRHQLSDRQNGGNTYRNSYWSAREAEIKENQWVTDDILDLCDLSRTFKKKEGEATKQYCTFLWTNASGRWWRKPRLGGSQSSVKA